MAPPSPDGLDGDPLGNVENEVDICVVVIIGAARYRNEVVSQLDVLCVSLKGRG